VGTTVFAQKIDVSGIWRSTVSGMSYELIQNGEEVTAKIVAGNSSDMAAYGYQIGELFFRGKIEGGFLRGEYLSKYPLDVKTICPQIAQVQWRPLEGRIGLNKIEGRYMMYSIDYGSCSEVNEGLGDWAWLKTAATIATVSAPRRSYLIYFYFLLALIILGIILYLILYLVKRWRSRVIGSS